MIIDDYPVCHVVGNAYIYTKTVEDYNATKKLIEGSARREIAREIFEEIDAMCIDLFGNFNHKRFAELKKKYTEGKE